MLEDGSCQNSYINKGKHITAAVTAPHIIF